MNGRRYVSLLALFALAACSSPAHPADQPTASGSPSPVPSATSAPQVAAARRVIAFNTGGLVSLDPVTLQRDPGARVPLRNVPVSQVLSPDGQTMALGSVSHGRIVLFDPASFTRTGVMRVLRTKRDLPKELLLVSWPTEHLMVAVAQTYLAHQLFAGQLLLIDPVNRQVRKRVPLRGMAIAEASAPDGTAVVLAGDVHDTGPGRLVVIDPTGGIRSTLLPAIKAGANTEADTQSPGLVVHGRTAYVVGEGEAITTVDLDSLRVVSHAVPGLMVERILPLDPPFRPGTGGIYRSIGRSAIWLGRRQVLVTGSDNFPARHHTRNQWVSHPAMIVDTHRWRVTRIFHDADRVEMAGGRGVFLEWRTNSRHRSFAATSSEGRLLWRTRLHNAYPLVLGSRLVISVGYHSRAEELNERTGKLVRWVRSWNPDYVVFWSRKHGMRVSPHLG